MEFQRRLTSFQVSSLLNTAEFFAAPSSEVAFAPTSLSSNTFVILPVVCPSPSGPNGLRHNN